MILGQNFDRSRDHRSRSQPIAAIMIAADRDRRPIARSGETKIPKTHPKVTQNGSFLVPWSQSGTMVPPDSLNVHEFAASRHPKETPLDPYGGPESQQILKNW